jgi:hypothetical protein
VLMNRTWREIEDLFGDGSDYQWALDMDKMTIEDTKDLNGSQDECQSERQRSS